MKYSYWGYWLVILGVFIVVVMLLIQNVTTANTQTDSLINEIAESSMIDSIDYAYYRRYSEIKINKEKFMESFVRRLAEATKGATTYDVEFFDIYEAPPKVSVQVSSSSNTFNVVGDATSFDIVDRIDSIIEGGSNGYLND